MAHKKNASKSHRRHKSVTPKREPEALKIITTKLADDGVELYRLRFVGHEAADDAWKTKRQLEERHREILEKWIEGLKQGSIKRREVHWKEEVVLRKVNAAGNSIVEEVPLRG
ncbi:Protein of unknown function [Pyronema omphalodes CBS 100304]|jgi:hypothetical protein|uniref:Chromo domain-containing protein n=1 Tax=Pyronema omphalodes (strain CBS 100304) TaxID=1076935 RepID=U4KUA0_PYROM|nr:Protein of unknown function [Pyronema omphalodes CBS 100304]